MPVDRRATPLQGDWLAVLVDRVRGVPGVRLARRVALGGEAVSEFQIGGVDMTTPTWPVEDLAGDVTVRMTDQHADPMRDDVVVLVEQRLSPVVKYAGAVQVSREVADDGLALRTFIDGAFDRWLRPWLFPDRRGWPATFDLFPAVTRWQLRIAVLRGLPSRTRKRLAETRYVLRHGLPEQDEDDW